MDIENEKVDIQDRKVDIESVLFKKGSDFSVKTTVHIHRLFEKFGFDEMFGRSAVMELLELKGSGASKLLSNGLQFSMKTENNLCGYYRRFICCLDCCLRAATI